MSSDDLPFRGVRAAIFDMDGTLVDSEPFTGHSVLAELRAADVDDPDLDTTRYYGCTWQSIATDLVQRHPRLAGRCTPESLDARFRRIWQESPPPPIPGMLRAIEAAGAHLATAIATSSHRGSVDDLFARLDVGRHFDAVVSAEDYERSKPDPQCFVLAARRLGVEPADCVVFEDSIAGLTAARAAGAKVVAVTHRSPEVQRARSLADLAVADYDELPERFFERISSQ